MMPSFVDSLRAPTPRDPSLAHTLSERAFLSMIGTTIAAGWLVSGLTLAAAHRAVLPWWAPLSALPLAYVGYEVTTRTTRWAGSALGFLLVAVALGVATEPILTAPALAVARSIGTLVFLGVLVLAVLSSLAPGTIRMFGTFLVASAVAWFVAGAGWPVIETIVGDALPLGRPTPIAAVGATLVLAYIDYYYTQATALPHTVDTALDAACALYVDPGYRVLSLADRVVPVTRPSTHRGL